METSNRIALAVEAIKEMDSSYWEKTLQQRLSTGAGSIILGYDSADELEKGILAAEWVEYTHPAIMEGCVAYKTTNLNGLLGVVELASLPPETVVTLDDRKGTGKVSAVVKGVRGEKIDYTVIILGTENGIEVVFTLHPGDPVNPSKVPAEGMDGKQVTVSEALGMGLTTVKIV